MLYRKKPIVIEAILWRGDNINELWDKFGAGSIFGPTPPEYPDLRIYTLEGMMTAAVGDYIIRGVMGELYPCKPDIFEITYEAVTSGDLEVKSKG